jgi:ribosomal protein L12E/L44/L45/RPP1/RPP2
MQYLAAYALVELSGKAPTKKDVEAVLKAGGVNVDGAKIDNLFKELEGKKTADLIEKGKKRIATCGGGAAAPAAAAPAAAAKEAPKKEEKKAAPVEEEDDGPSGPLRLSVELVGG